MPDLNKLMGEIEKDSSGLKKDLRKILAKYEELYREGNKIFIAERIASGSMEGLQEFYRLIQNIKRNRDVLGSLMRGIMNLRTLTSFKFVEETISEPKIKKSIKKPKIEHIEEEMIEPEALIEEFKDA